MWTRENSIIRFHCEKLHYNKLTISFVEVPGEIWYGATYCYDIFACMYLWLLGNNSDSYNEKRELVVLWESGNYFIQIYMYISSYYVYSKTSLIFHNEQFL